MATRTDIAAFSLSEPNLPEQKLINNGYITYQSIAVVYRFPYLAHDCVMLPKKVLSTPAVMEHCTWVGGAVIVAFSYHRNPRWGEGQPSLRITTYDVSRRLE